MPLTLKADGLNPENLFTSSWVNDFTNLLTGVMHDQNVVLDYRPGVANSKQTLVLKGDGFNALFKAYKVDGTTQAALLDSNGNLTLAGALNVAGSVTFSSTVGITAANGGLEIGAVGAANTPYVDFHSGTGTSDYSSRILASGGAGVDGDGSLNIIAATLKLNSKPLLFGNNNLTGKFDALPTPPPNPAVGDLWLDLSVILG